MRTQSVILNLIPSGVNPVVHLSQYDQEDDGALLFNIYDGNVLADLTGCTATIEGTKPDGTFYMYPCTVYSTYLTCAVNFQMTSIAGNYPAEVRIKRGGENVGTINLTMMVEPAGVGRVDVSDTEIPSLLDDIETSVDEAEYWAHVAEHAVTGVASWNGRTGAVNPAAGDYNASQVDYDNTDSGLTSNRAQGAIDELTPKKIITADDAFDPTKTYTTGEWLIHQGVLYKVITACTGITPPNATYYATRTIEELLTSLRDKTVCGKVSAFVGSFDDLKSALSAKAATMKLYSIENMVISLSAVFSEFPAGGNYGVTIYQSAYRNYFSAIFMGYDPQEIKLVVCRNDIWTCYNLVTGYHTEPTISSGASSFTINSSYAYRQGTHIHAEVYGTVSADDASAAETPFFTLSGIKAPAASKYVGTVIVTDGAQHPAYSIPSLVQLRTNKYFYQRVATSLVSGQKLGFIVDYCE